MTKKIFEKIKLNSEDFKLYLAKIVASSAVLVIAYFLWRHAVTPVYHRQVIIALVYYILWMIVSITMIFALGLKKPIRDSVILACCIMGVILLFEPGLLLTQLPLLFFMLVLLIFSIVRALKNEVWQEIFVKLFTIISLVVLVSQLLGYMINFIAVVAIFVLLGCLFIPIFLLLFPLYVIAWWRSEKRGNIWIFVSISVLFIVSFSLVTPLKDVVKRKQDPCYQVIQGKGPIWSIKEDRVCMQDYNSAASLYIRTLEGADAETFENIDGYYFKDKDHVYYASKILEGINPKTFKVLDFQCATDGDKYFKQDVLLDKPCEAKYKK